MAMVYQKAPRGLSHFVVPSCSNNVAPGKAGVRSRNSGHVPVQLSFWCATSSHFQTSDGGLTSELETYLQNAGREAKHMDGR